MADIFFSPLNQFRFVPNQLQRGGLFNTDDFDKVLYPYQELYWQDQKCYAQPIQKKDGLKIFFNAIGFVNNPQPDQQSRAHLIKKDGGLIKSEVIILDEFRVQTDSGINYFYHSSNPDFFDGLDDGIYAIVLELWYRDGITPSINNQAFFYSDAINVKDVHSDTLLIQYYNYYTKLGILFEQMPNLTTNLKLRVSGSLTDIGYLAERTVFDDQDGNPMQLKSIANRSFKFYFGGDRSQLPDYMVDKLNHIFSLSNIEIDNVAYSVTSDSTLEKEGVSTNGLYGASIVLSKKDNIGSYKFVPSNSGERVVLDFNEVTYPFAINAVVVLDNNGIVLNPNIQQSFFIIQNETQRGGYITALNNSLLPSVDSRFSLVSGVLILNQEVGDNILNVRNPTVYQKGFRLETSYVNNTSTSNYNISSLVLRSDMLATSNLNATQSNDSSTIFTLNAPSAGDYYTLVFVNNNVVNTLTASGIEFVSINPFGNNNVGYPSDRVNQLVCYDGSAVYNLDLNKWANTLDLLNVNPIVLNLRFTSTTYQLLNFALLNNIRFSSLVIILSGINSANTDKIFNDLYQASLNGVPMGNVRTLNIRSNTGSATNNSLVARNYLQTVLGINILV